jgi:hypothetical protein
MQELRDEVLVCHELERTGKKVVNYFKLPCIRLPVETKQNHENFRMTISSVELRAGYKVASLTFRQPAWWLEEMEELWECQQPSVELWLSQGFT